MALVITLAPGTPTRLEVDCVSCGWTDVWQVSVHTLSSSGVGIAGQVQVCSRCRTRQ